tara:strand:- start:1956 stop:2735 length:780 start_codon:yes stop_codon:yes gene_type:complete
MKKHQNLTASIVLFNEDFEILNKTIDCFLRIKNFNSKLYLIDNSRNSFFKDKFLQPNIEYYSSDKNLGFGRGHNLVLEKIKHESDYHLVLNPDVVFEPEVIDTLVIQLKKDSSLSMIAPKVLFPDGKFQHSCRRYPKISEMFFRRFSVIKNLSKSIVNKGIYKDKNLDNPFYAEYLTGCFHLYKTEDFLEIGGFDNRYFLYMEDIDICKKIDAKGTRKMYFPEVEITHVLKQGSSKDYKLFFRHTTSMIKYFLKWGVRL